MKKLKLLLVVLLGATLVACGSKEETTIELKKKEFKIEYGTETPEDAKSYVKADKDILKETGISFKDVKYESREVDGKEIKYLEVGTYKATAVYKDETLDFKITVKDTTAPEFIDFPDKIEIERGTEDVDYSNYFKAEDLSTVTIGVVADPEVDLNTVGEYSITVTAVDESKNESKKESKVVVKEKTEENQETNQQTDQDTQTTVGTSNGATGGDTSGSTNNTSGSTGSGTSGSSTPSNPTPTPARPQVVAGTCEPNNGRFGAVGNSGVVCNGLDAARAWENSYSDELDDATYMKLSNFVEWTVYDNQGERNDIWTIEIVWK